MEAIAFVLWMIGWPLINDIGSYYIAKTKEITGVPHAEISSYAEFIAIFLWAWVGAMLYGKI